MSTYPIWWNTTITLYNKYEDARGEVTWYRRVIEGCFWKYVGDQVRVADRLLSTEDTVVRIPESSDFLESYEWKQGDRTSYFTVQRGDIVIRAEVEDEIDEYTKGQRATDLLNKYRDIGCIEVAEWTNDTGAGRVHPHYRIKGV